MRIDNFNFHGNVLNKEIQRVGSFFYEGNITWKKDHTGCYILEGINGFLIEVRLLSDIWKTIIFLDNEDDDLFLLESMDFSDLNKAKDYALRTVKTLMIQSVFIKYVIDMQPDKNKENNDNVYYLITYRNWLGDTCNKVIMDEPVNWLIRENDGIRKEEKTILLNSFKITKEQYEAL